MEKQTNLFRQEKGFKPGQELEQLELQENTLEREKFKFLRIMSEFIESSELDKPQDFGRPKASLSDLMKCLLVMSYNGMSYRRTHSDIIELFNKRIINKIPKRSTLNKYICLTETKKLLEKLIQASSLMFIDKEDTLICDSTWESHTMYGGGYKVVYDKENAPLDKCTKMHIACLKNSKLIACAKVTKGTTSDFATFKELVVSTLKNGFVIRNLLADAGYSSKENYSFCSHLNIDNVFIDFKKNSVYNPRSKTPWSNQLKMFMSNNDAWHEKYRFRVVVEGIFSAMKRKQVNYLRSRNQIARENELLIKALVYNLCVIGRYF